jgi:hypothetical protein
MFSACSLRRLGLVFLLCLTPAARAELGLREKTDTGKERH